MGDEGPTKLPPGGSGMAVTRTVLRSRAADLRAMPPGQRPKATVVSSRKGLGHDRLFADGHLAERDPSRESRFGRSPRHPSRAARLLRGPARPAN